MPVSFSISVLDSHCTSPMMSLINCQCRHVYFISKLQLKYSSSMMRKSGFCLCENKGAYHLADQGICFSNIDSTFAVIPKSNFKPLAIFCINCTAQFVLDQVRYHEVRSMQRSGTKAIRTQIQPSKTKQEITNVTNSQDTKENTWLTE